MQFVQCHAVAPDGCPALHDHQRAAGDVRQRGQRLRGGDGRGDGDGVDDGGGYYFFFHWESPTSCQDLYRLIAALALLPKGLSQ